MSHNRCSHLIRGCAESWEGQVSYARLQLHNLYGKTAAG